MQHLRDRSREFEELGIAVFGVSRDSPYSHRRFGQQYWLSVPLLTDWTGEAVEALGLAQHLSGMDGVPMRANILIDAAGTVRGAWAYGNDELPDFDAVLAAC
ncbi:MAG TPA: redoxin domain-containing protein, partial [Thermoleophilia bacterium]|nr:redoxin domain-containing protein [Thermoleophilia bacterium]